MKSLLPPSGPASSSLHLPPSSPESLAGFRPPIACSLGAFCSLSVHIPPCTPSHCSVLHSQRPGIAASLPHSAALACPHGPSAGGSHAGGLCGRADATRACKALIATETAAATASSLQLPHSAQSALATAVLRCSASPSHGQLLQAWWTRRGAYQPGEELLPLEWFW